MKFGTLRPGLKYLVLLLVNIGNELVEAAHLRLGVHIVPDFVTQLFRLFKLLLHVLVPLDQVILRDLAFTLPTCQYRHPD